MMKASGRAVRARPESFRQPHIAPGPERDSIRAFAYVRPTSENMMVEVEILSSLIERIYDRAHGRTDRGSGRDAGAFTSNREDASPSPLPKDWDAVAG